MDNLLLSNLPGDALASLRPHFERVSLRHGQHAIVPDEPVRHFYFPVSCLLSMVTTMQNGASVECNTVGREGMSGIPVLLDAVSTPMPTFCQVPGEAIRVKAEVVKDAYERDRGVRKYFNRYIHTVIVNGSHSAACNRLHGLEERLARWLLMSSDGIGSDEVALTHEYLAVMLGVRRAGVTEASVKMKEAGLITYKRGDIQILDRAGLEAESCECYERTKSEYGRLFTNQPRPTDLMTPATFGF
jgi:CRP-like cAMP-binding protein